MRLSPCQDVLGRMLTNKYTLPELLHIRLLIKRNKVKDIFMIPASTYFTRGGGCLVVVGGFPLPGFILTTLYEYCSPHIIIFK